VAQFPFVLRPLREVLYARSAMNAICLMGSGSLRNRILVAEIERLESGDAQRRRM